MTEAPVVVIGPFKVGEKPAPFIYQFLDASGAVLNITGYVARFNCREQDSTTGTFGAAVSIADAVNGKVQYTWTGTEMPTAGHYLAEVWVGNGTQRFASVNIVFDAFISVGPIPAI